MRVGVFSEVGHPYAGTGHFSGVSNFLRYNLAFCRATGLEMDLHSYTDEDRLDREGPTRLYGWRPRMEYRVDPTISQDASHLLGDRRLLEVAIERRYDVINLIAPGTMGLQGARLARALGIPAVAMFTTSLAEYAGKRVGDHLSWAGPLKAPAVGTAEAVGWLTMKRFYRRGNGLSSVLVPTATIRDELASKIDVPMKILGRGVDTRLFQPRAPKDKTSKPILLYTGRLHRGEKGLDTFVTLADRYPQAHILMVGDGPHRESLESDLGTRATFTGALHGKDLADAYHQGDVFVFPSSYDTYGQVVNEAMACGLPVVVTDQGGPKELVKNGVTGFIADEGTFVQRVGDLIASPSLRDEMGRAAAKAAGERSWPTVFRTLWCYYREAVLGPHSSDTFSSTPSGSSKLSEIPAISSASSQARSSRHNSPSRASRSCSS